MKPTLEYDAESMAWYVRLAPVQPSVRQSELSNTVHIDWSDEGKMLGIEILEGLPPDPAEEKLHEVVRHHVEMIGMPSSVDSDTQALVGSIIAAGLLKRT